MEKTEITDKFVLGYLRAALYLMGDVDQGYSVTECSPELLQQAQQDCFEFKSQAGSFWVDAMEAVGYDEDSAGIDFWLTRNHHGTGYDDRDLLNEPVRKHLKDVSKRFRDIDVYKGDDCLLYFG